MFAECWPVRQERETLDQFLARTTNTPILPSQEEQKAAIRSYLQKSCKKAGIGFRANNDGTVSYGDLAHVYGGSVYRF